MHIVMVGYMDLTGPGVVHLYHFANELERRGHKVFVLLDGDPRTVELMEQPPLCRLAQMRFTPYDLHPSLVREIKAFRPDIVHIWTPRNVPARVGLSVKYHTKARLLIHYEDDEDYLYEFHQGNVLGDLHYFVHTLREPRSWTWQHPVVSFLANHFADAFTAICPAYLPRLERRWGKCVFLLYPGVDLQRFHPGVDATELRQRYGLEGQEVVLYSGSIAAFHQFELILQAFAMLTARRPQVRLVHIGHNRAETEVRAWVRRLGVEDRVHFLGAIPHKEVHRYLALGDVLVQCGRPGVFNEFRLPSKLPEYLAMGKPVVTFSAGIGRELTDGEEVLKTYTGEPEELAAKLAQALEDPQLRKRLGSNARRKAEMLFDWQRNTQGLIAVYETVLNDQVSSSVRPRVRPSVVTESFGIWWQTSQRRHILMVVSDGAHPSADVERSRAAALCQALEACGHRVTIAVPNSCLQAAFGTDNVRDWDLDALNLLVWEMDPEVLLFTHWSSLRALDPLARRPVVLDLASGWSASPGALGEVLQCLAKVDFFLCDSEGERTHFLRWAERYGFWIEPDEIASLPVLRSSTNAQVDEPDAQEIDPLDRFCRTPFIRRPVPITHSNQKTFGMLVDEAIRHYRRGGFPTLARETWGFLCRRLRG